MYGLHVHTIIVSGCTIKKDMTKAMAYVTQQKDMVQQHNYLVNYLVVDEILVVLDALVMNSHL